MNFKRGRAKNQRSGCLMCKPWKANGVGKTSREFESLTSHRSRIASIEDLRSFLSGAEDDNFNLTGTEFDGSMDFVDDYEPSYRRTVRRSYQPWVAPVVVIPPREFVASF